MIRLLLASLLFLLSVHQEVAAQPYFTGYKEPPNLKERIRLSWAMHGQRLMALPDVTDATFDCRAKGWVSPVKNQKTCGSCWDFSGTGAAEMAFIRSGYAKPDGSFALSEQYTLDCGQNGGCDGDMPATVLDWCQRVGLPTTADYGDYTARAGRCKSSSSMKMWKIDNHGYVGQEEGVAPTQAIKNAMAQYGPISAALCADQDFSNIQPGQVFQGSGNNKINHAIILVGWDDAKGAWLLRNSWDSSWCDGGYCWIKYGANGVGTSAMWADVKSIVPPTPPPAPPEPPGQGGSPVPLIVAAATAFVLGRASKSATKSKTPAA